MFDIFDDRVQRRSRWILTEDVYLNGATLLRDGTTDVKQRFIDPCNSEVVLFKKGYIFEFTNMFIRIGSNSWDLRTMTFKLREHDQENKRVFRISLYPKQRSDQKEFLKALEYLPS